jgi:hypothetical protein
MLLQERDFVEAAFRLECEVEAIKAVCAVEAPRGGFVDGQPTILFEGHIFHKYTKGKFSESHPTLSYPKWVTKFYGKTQGQEHARLATACTLDKRAALMSASWGKFQIMGFNFALCGFKSVEDFVKAMYKGEGEQLDAFVEYMIASSLMDELQEHRWADFARFYNGPLYQRNQYDIKLAREYAKLKAQPSVGK